MKLEEISQRERKSPLMPGIHGSKFDQFSRELLNFVPCRSTVVLQKLIYRLNFCKPLPQISHSWSALQAISSNVDLCILGAGRSPCCQNIMSQWGGFPHQPQMCRRRNQVPIVLMKKMYQSMDCLRQLPIEQMPLLEVSCLPLVLGTNSNGGTDSNRNLTESNLASLYPKL